LEKAPPETETMCGIVGYVGGQEPVALLVDGLRRLEYRGYDSAGVAVVADGCIRNVRALGKLQELVRKLEAQPVTGRYGLAHTRWATHGRPSERNAHPILDARARVAVIHNGIIENYAELCAELRQAGWEFATETDTEVVANLISAELEREHSLLHAVRAATRRLQGHYAFAAVTTACDGEEIVVARHGPPLALGLAAGEQFLASDPAALLPHTRDVLFLENGDVARLRRSGVELCDAAGSAVVRQVRHLDWDPVQIDRGGYRHYMLKEIHEQPHAVQATLAGRVCFESGRIDLAEIGPLASRLGAVQRLQLVACGTSWHAALVGKFLIEEIARLPVDVDYASEYRYRNPLVDPGVLTVGISQSGETADTLSAMELARERGAGLLAICNVAGSQATRLSDGVLLTRAGPEIGVASTKAFTTQLVALYLLALALRQGRGEVERSLVSALAHLPEALAGALAEEPAIERLARRYLQTRNALFLGRGINYPIALEGALKLKEISYVHAEGYPAGEMKHGPIALIDPELPTFALVSGRAVFEKMISNLCEVRSRDGEVVAITDRPAAALAGVAGHVIQVPAVGELLQPIVNVVPLQLVAYHVAVHRGADVDQPRNLAKSVTVE
jgi:glutamine---fructose-6-phosphate transaminase (isomerizing)